MSKGEIRNRLPPFSPIKTGENLDAIVKEAGLSVSALFQPLSEMRSSFAFRLIVLSMRRQTRSESTRTSPMASIRRGVLRNTSFATRGSLRKTNIVKRYYPIINRYYQKKLAQTNEAVAIKAISNKLARASYYLLRDQAAYDEIKLFGGRAEPAKGLVGNRKG